MPKRYTNKKKGAILYQYGSKFLHKLLDIESFLVKHTDLTRNRLYIMGGCCLTITGMIRSLFRGKAFTPIAWIINSIFSLSGLLISIFLFIIAVSAVYFIQNHSEEFSDEYDEERNFTKSASGTHGTASFLEGEEIKDVYGLCPEKKLENLNGFLIGKVPDISRNTGHIGDIVTRDETLMQKKFLSNRNTLIIGSPGTGKSAGIMIQNLIESAKRGESVFVTDPKGELCDKTSPIFKELGYTVKVFNLVYPWHSDKWNVMEWLAGLGSDNEKWVSTISSMIIKNTNGGEKTDAFWETNADKLLRALMSFLLEIASPKAKLKDKKLEEYEKRLRGLRAERNQCEILTERDYLNQQIADVIRERYQYLSKRVDSLKIQIESCTTQNEKQRLTKIYQKLVAFRNDEMLLPILDKDNPPDDFEPLTLAEAKKRILNLPTCSQLLQLRIYITKEEMADFASWYALPKREKITRLVYELAFQVPYESRTYKTLYQVFSICDPNRSLAFSYWSSFTEASENLRTSVKGGLDTRLSAFNQHFIRKMLSENAIDLEKPGQEKCAYFCIISDQETSLSYISSLFITVAFETLRSQADSLTEKRLSRRVMFYLDEFANIGYLPDFTKKLSTLRSRDIHIILAIQNLPQTLQRYDENTCLEIFGDCDLMLFLGCGNETKTPEFVSALMGKMTTSTIVKRENGNKLMPFRDLDYSTSEQQNQRDLMYLSEVRGLEQNRLIAITRGEKPMQVDKYMYFHRPDYKWIESLIKKYPVISGKPLDKEDAIDLNEIHEPEVSAVYPVYPVRPKSPMDTIASAVDLQMKSVNPKNEIDDFVEHLQELQAEGQYTPEQLSQIIHQSLGISENAKTKNELSEPAKTTDATVNPYEDVTDGFVPLAENTPDENKTPQKTPQAMYKYETPQITRKLSKRKLNNENKVNPKDI